MQIFFSTPLLLGAPPSVPWKGLPSSPDVPQEIGCEWLCGPREKDAICIATACEKNFRNEHIRLLEILLPFQTTIILECNNYSWFFYLTKSVSLLQSFKDKWKGISYSYNK